MLPSVRASTGFALQALQRIHDEGQRLPLDLDLLERVLDGGLVDSRQRQHRLADEQRLVREDLRARRRLLRHFVGGEDAVARLPSSAPRTRRCSSRVACGNGLGMKRQNAMPSARKSSAYFA